MSSTLGDMVVAITGDTTDFNLSVDAAGKKLDLLAQVTAKSAVDMTASFKKIDNEVKLWGNSTDLIAQKQKALKDEMTNLMAQGFGPMSAKVQSLKTQYGLLEQESIALAASQVTMQEKMVAVGTQMKSMGLAMSVGVTLPILGAAKAAVESSAQMEMLQASFTTFLGNADQASLLMNNIIQMAAKTPFVTTDLASGAKMLMQYGIATKDVIPDLRMLGDVSAGNSEIFNRLVYAFGQISSNGKLMGQDLRQMSEAGFNPLYVISQKTGESMENLRKRMAAGGIAASEVADALRIATSEGGKFFGGMERGSQTFTGLVSTLKDNIGIMGRSISDSFIPALKNIVKELSNFAQWVTGLNPEIKAMIVSMTAFAAIAGPVVLGIGLIITAIGSMTAATASFMAIAGPVVLAVGAMVAVITLIGTKAAESKKQMDALATAMKGTSDPVVLNNAVLELNKQIKAQQDLIGIAKARKVPNDALIDQEKKLADLTATRDRLALQLGKSLEAASYAGTTAAEKEAEKEDEWTTKRKAAEVSLASQFALIDEKQKLALASGEEYDAQAEKRKALLEIINKMLEQGFTFEGVGIQHLIEDNLNLMNGEEARFEALNRMGQEYADAQAENNAKIANAEQARGQALEDQGQAYIDQQNRISAAEQAKWNLLNKMGKDYIDTENKAISLTLDIATKSVSVMNDIKSAINSTDPLGGLEKAAEHLVSTFGPEGQIVSSIMNVTSSIVDIVKNMNDSIAKSQKDLTDTTISLNQQIMNAKIQNNQDALTNTLAAIDKEEQAALTAAGFKDQTAMDQLNQQKADAIKSGDIAKAQELNTAIAKQAIIDQYEAKKQAAQEASDKIARQLAHDKAIMDRDIALAQAAIAEQEAIAKLPWYDWITGSKGKKQIEGLYDTLIPLIQATPIPAAAEGAIVNPTPSGTIMKVAEAGQPEVIFPLDQLNRFISKGFNINNTDNTSNEGNINLIVNLDSKPFLDKIFPATKNRTILISQGAVV